MHTCKNHFIIDLIKGQNIHNLILNDICASILITVTSFHVFLPLQRGPNLRALSLRYPDSAITSQAPTDPLLRGPPLSMAP